MGNAATIRNMSRILTLWALLVCMLCLMGRSATAQASTADTRLADAAQIGLQPGMHAPTFQLPSTVPGKNSLLSLAGPNGLVLVFFRSADW